MFSGPRCDSRRAWTKQHIAKVSAACFYHLRRLRQIRRHVGQAIVTRLMLAMITSRLDYCNSVLAGLPKQSTLEPLQKVQNCAARLIFNSSHHDHITPCLIQLRSAESTVLPRLSRPTN